MSFHDFKVGKLRSWFVLSLALCALLMFGACAPSQRTMARDKVTSLFDTLIPPANAVLLFEEVGVSKPNRHGCWAAYADNVYGTEDSALTVLNHYEQLLSRVRSWAKNIVIVSDDTAVYDHDDGSSVHLSTDISWDFPNEFEKHHTRFKTLFFVGVTWQSPDMRKRCREY